MSTPVFASNVETTFPVRPNVKLGNRRLLKAARILREKARRKDFNMDHYANACGTPACVLGHYAVHTRGWKLVVEPRPCGHAERVEVNGNWVSYISQAVLDHFAVTEDEACELFGPSGVFGPPGCGGARTPIQAAKYIEAFVARRSK